MDNTSSGIMIMLTCVVACLGLVGFIGLATLMVWFIRRQWTPKDEAALASEKDAMRSQLDGMAADLRPWSPGVLSDLSTDWDAIWTKLGRDLSAKGKIPSLGEPKGPAPVAFALRTRGARQADGQLLARTSSRFFEYRLAPELVAVKVDGAPLGSIRADGTLLDAQGQPVGSAPRAGGEPVVFSIGGFKKIQDKREPYPVTLRGRVLGQVANPPAQMTNAISLKKQEFPPAVVPEGELSDEEETWLLALAILQVAGYNLLETLWTN